MGNVEQIISGTTVEGVNSVAGDERIVTRATSESIVADTGLEDGAAGGCHQRGIACGYQACIQRHATGEGFANQRVGTGSRGVKGSRTCGGSLNGAEVGQLRGRELYAATITNLEILNIAGDGELSDIGTRKQRIHSRTAGNDGSSRGIG